MESIKYILTQQGGDVWTSEGKITLSSETTQKQLEHLHSIGYDGVIKVESEKPKK